MHNFKNYDAFVPLHLIILKRCAMQQEVYVFYGRSRYFYSG